MTSARRVGMDSKRFRRVCCVMLAHESITAWRSSSSVDGALSWTKCFMRPKTFSTGLRSGLFWKARYPIRVSPCCSRNSLSWWLWWRPSLSINKDLNLSFQLNYFQKDINLSNSLNQVPLDLQFLLPKMLPKKTSILMLIQLLKFFSQNLIQLNN